MGWLVRGAVGLVVLLVAVSFAAQRWNARGGLFDPEVAVDYTHDGQEALAVVTGGNAGLGYEVVRGLALMNYRVVSGVRDLSKGKVAVKRLEQEEGEIVAQRVTIEEIDQESFESVRRFAATITPLGPIQVLVLNAGIFINQQRIEGVSKTAYINHYAGFLLANLLYPQMRQGSRLIVITSLLSQHAVDFRNDLHLNEPSLALSPGFKLYGSSKLMNILHARAFAQRTSKVQVNAVHPGIFKTELHREENENPPTFVTYIVRAFLYGIVAISSRQGAASTLWVATANHSYTGEFFHGRLPRVPPSPLGLDKELGEILWRESVRITKQDLVV
jgi:NAD(P)-dependent dehydrogenase (short-subunit alcohol dehydrogenase family)